MGWPIVWSRTSQSSTTWSAVPWGTVSSTSCFTIGLTAAGDSAGRCFRTGLVSASGEGFVEGVGSCANARAAQLQTAQTVMIERLNLTGLVLSNSLYVDATSTCAVVVAPP